MFEISNSLRLSFRAVFVGLAMGFIGSLPVAADSGDRPVVVELFTSQGCYSCPPAEAFLGELITRGDVLALEYHVDYWDYIGWEDPFASRAFTDRQKAYQNALHARYVYTPQMVIDGAAHVVGSDRKEAAKAIKLAVARLDAAPDLRLSLQQGSEDTLTVELAGDAAGQQYTVTLVTFDYSHETEIKRGENRGKTLTNHHVVREMQLLGAFDGSDFAKTVPVKRFSYAGGHAVLVQELGNGPVVHANYITWNSSTTSLKQ